ncbi:MAG: hypothetical protein JOZ77_12655 [Candidatus Eremiobacteraeota bacterium]|nr:hypothetical protein [Candidatus Eremiobacteraeota bacterium]
MEFVSLGRLALSISATALLLSACGGSTPPIGTLGAADNNVNSHPQQKTFLYTGTEQSFKVPASVTRIDVVARGASGGTQYYQDGGGRGGRVHAIIPVVPGERLAVFVGGAASGLNQTNGGFNGGGNGGGPYQCCTGTGGGGASDVRQHGDRPSNRVVVAGGGGGQGAGNGGGVGGSGGGPTGGSGGQYGYACDGGGGSGGNQTSGGAGGAGGLGSQAGGPGAPGSRGAGGTGGAEGEGSSSTVGAGGGGGGGGYFGGGGGGGGGGYCFGYGGGGGGGSSYIEPNAIKFHTWRGWKNATSNGLVVLSWQ